MKIKNVLKAYKLSLVLAKRNIERNHNSYEPELDDLVNQLEIIIKNIEER